MSVVVVVMVDERVESDFIWVAEYVATLPDAEISDTCGLDVAVAL